MHPHESFDERLELAEPMTLQDRLLHAMVLLGLGISVVLAAAMLLGLLWFVVALAREIVRMAGE